MPRLACIAFSLALLGLTACGPSAPNPVVVMETSLGTIKIELFQDKAPISTENFLAYVDKKHYDGTIFHRVIKTFMIQGGGLDVDMTEKKTDPPITNESDNGLLNDRGTVAMARTNQPNSATSQFFINVEQNDFLNRAKAKDKVGYAVFGKVIAGMNVVDEIRAVPIQPGDVPVEQVVIKSVRRVETK